jgi:S-formylglutathione hydrolase FrmB
VKLLAEKKIPYEYREISPRGHSWDFWDDQIRVFLDMLASRPGFRED